MKRIHCPTGALHPAGLDHIPSHKNTLWGCAFFILALIFLALRISLLFFRPEFYINIEELYMGTIAKGVSDGFIMPLTEYMYHPYEGGTLLFGLSAYPFFALLGPTHFALKITALVYSFAAFSLWYLFMLRFFGRVSAVFFGLLFCFAPFGYILLSLWAMGTHPQNALFDIVILFAFYSFFFNPSPRQAEEKIPWSIAVFGFVSGLGIYFCYFSTLTIIVCIITWLTVPHRPLGAKAWRMLLLSFILGLAPFLYCNLILRAGGVRSLLASMGGRELASATFAGSIMFFLRLLFKDAYWFNSGSPHCAVGAYHLFYALLMALSLIWIVWARRSALLRQCIFFLPPGRRQSRRCDEYRATPIIIYIALYFFIVGAAHLERRITTEIQTGQFSGYRFFSVLFPYLFAAMALFLSRLWAHRSIQARMLSVVAAILVILFGCLPITMDGTLSSPFHKGYSFYLLGWRVAQKNVYWNTPVRGLELSEKISTITDRDDFIDGFCEIRWWDAIEADEAPPIPSNAREDTDALVRSNVVALAEHIRGVDNRYKRQFYKAFGRVLCLRYIYEMDRRIDKCMELLSVTDPTLRASTFEGLGQVVGSYEPTRRNIEAIAPHIPKEYETAFKQGIDSAAKRPYIQIVH